MKKKILYITDLPLLENDAPSLHVTQICKGLAQLGNDVHLLAPNINRITTDSYKTSYIPSTKQYIILLFQPLVSIYLVSLLFINKYSAIYVRQSPFLIMPFLIGKLFHVYTLIEVNGTQEEEIKLYEKSLFFKLFLEWKILHRIEKITYITASQIISVTDGIKQYIIHKYHIEEKKIITLNNGVDTNKFYPNDVIAYDSLRYHHTKDELYIGYIGGITTWQGLEYLIKAFHHIIKKHTHVKLIIVGDGDYKLELMKNIKDLQLTKDVVVLNKIHHSLVPQYINSFDVCISYPTKVREGITSPFKMYEYLACGKPVITSNIQGVGDIFKDVAVVAKAEDAEDLEKKISQTITNKQLMKHLGQKARAYIVSGHSWLAVSDKINTLIISNNK